MRPDKRYADEGERMPKMILHRSVIHGQQLRRQPRLERVRPERPQRDRGRPGEGSEDQEQLQFVFFVFFARCGRFLP